jgi:quercetin dioxygenase-like cupin family protein
MFNTFTASLEDMQDWADSLMESRDPDFVIGDDYLRRWWVIPRNNNCNVYLHDIRKSDDDRALHDHPWQNSSWLLRGSYFEHVPGGQVNLVKQGDFLTRAANALHRLEIIEGDRVVSLFITGPKIREWGFDCPQGWRHWRAFVQPHNSGLPGRGCGEA